MNKKRAFLLIASGNTGCRLCTSLFLQSGCWGDVVGDSDNWSSRLDKGMWPKDAECIVWRTHNNKDEEKITGRAGATSIYRMVDQCLERGYEPTILTIYRDICITSYGAVKRGHRTPPFKNGQQLNQAQARQQEKQIQINLIGNYAQDFRVLEEMQNRGHRVFVIDMAALQKNPILYIRMFAATIDFPLNDQVKIHRNADSKHYSRFSDKESLEVYRDKEK